jgi:hypothetical protein
MLVHLVYILVQLFLVNVIHLADTKITNAYLEGFDAVSTGLLFQDTRGSTLRNMLETADSYTIFQCLV